MSSSYPAPHPSRPLADELAHIFDEVVSHPCALARYARSGWWAGVPRAKVART